MIRSFRDKRDRRIPPELQDRLFRKLQILDDAMSQRDLASPPSNQFEALQGRMAGKYSIRVNIQWRLIFKWEDTNASAEDIYLDNHSYR